MPMSCSYQILVFNDALSLSPYDGYTFFIYNMSQRYIKQAIRYLKTSYTYLSVKYESLVFTTG